MKTDLKTIDVWLEVGREGRCFRYLDGKRLGVDLGDIVLVKLKGRETQGIVVNTGFFSIEKNNKIRYENVESLVEPAAVDTAWREWIEVSAKSCYTSSLRMIKAAMPPGWIGFRKKYQAKEKLLWWIFLVEQSFDRNKITSRQSELENHLLSKGGAQWQKKLIKEGFTAQIIQGLINTGRASKEKRHCNSELFENYLDETKNLQRNKLPVLTGEQEVAIQTFSSLPAGGAMLLWGVTGSGKTEVYLQLAEQAFRNGESSLILAPEIGLIPQLVDRFSSRFGSSVLEYHSGCSDKERVKTWRKSRTSNYPLIVIGTRSAVFLPLDQLGLIVVDEEHDRSYKQESPMPCYNARNLALDRAKRNGSKIVLGSATPSLITWRSLHPKGSIVLAKLSRRISNRPLPEVHIVDMRKEFLEGHKRLFSRYLMESISKLPSKGEQAVVLVPKRGYSSFISCRSCGEVVQCPNCDVSLTMHKTTQGEEFLRCHWCDYRQNFGSTCTECGSSAFKPFGAGTQRVLEKLIQELEGLRVLRFDRDSTRGRDGHRRLLEQFAAGQADVLIGTQMLAKGMDLPNVTLACVIAADGLLHRPDLQASEESLQLLMQLAGRAGRGEIPGKVIIQTYCPDHPVICDLKDGKYESFLKKETELRQINGLMPFSRACLLRVSGQSPSLTASAAAALSKRLRPLCDALGWMLIGPAPSMVSRVAGKTRWQLLLHGPEGSELPLPCEVNSLWEDLPKGISLSIDPDPMQL